MITAREKNFLPGRSLRTISHAMRPPTRMLPTETQDAISKEFSRSRDNGELDQSCYSPIEWEKLMFLIKDPNAFYVKFYIRSKRERLLEKKVHILRKRVTIREERIKSAEKRARIAEKRVAELESSTTFKVGKAVMFIPISIKKVIFRVMGKEA